MSNAYGVTDVAELLALMERWGIAEVHLTEGDASLDLVRAVPSGPAMPAGMSAAPCGDGVAAGGVSVEPEPVVVRAPVVGVFNLARRDFPQGGPLPGDAVRAGQTIGSIELMHVPSDVNAPISGTIEAVMVDDGAGVEYDQPLMVIRPA